MTDINDLIDNFDYQMFVDENANEILALLSETNIRKSILSYPISGSVIVHPIRLLLEYSGADWEDKLYSWGPPPTFDDSSWTKGKQTLGLDFPNLPWIMDGDVKLTQSEAVLRYVARKFKLDGQTEVEKQRADMVFAEAKDIRESLANLCYSPDFVSLKRDFLKTIPLKVERLSKFLGDRPYFAGDNLTFADFMIYDLLDQLKVLEPEILKKYKNLEDFQERFEGLDRIAACNKTAKFCKFPFNGKMASFGA